jgi:hypothetical protein
MGGRMHLKANVGIEAGRRGLLDEISCRPTKPGLLDLNYVVHNL